VAAGGADGIGFVLGAGLVGIDLDECIGPDGALHDIAYDAIALGSYAEKSPSGRGVHVFIRATIAESRKIGKSLDTPGREIYDGRVGSARYLTVTGECVGSATHLAEGPEAQARLDAFVAKWFDSERPKGADIHIPKCTAAQDATGRQPPEMLEDEAVLRIMFGAKDRAKWRRVFDGNFSGYPSQSEADLALCGKLRFYSGGSAAQMDRIFRRSGLMRPKWDEQHGNGTYGRATIAKALERGGPIYRARDDRDDASKRNEWKRRAWGRVPAWWAIRLGGVGELGCRVLLVIAAYTNTETGQAWPTVQTISTHLSVSERRVKAALQTLKSAGLLDWNSRVRASNLYRPALTVPDIITPYATRPALRVPVSEHDGCRSRRTVTDDIDRHRERTVTKRVMDTGTIYAEVEI
jgi:hypothetical protein